MNILALEASTSAAKALLFSDNVVKRVESEEYKKPTTKSLMQKPEDILSALYRVGRNVAEGENIDIISIGSTWHSLLLCDKKMKPIAEEYSWQYTGASTQAERIRSDRELFNRIYHTTGCLVHSAYPAYKVMQLRESGTDIKNSVITDLGSYIHYELTDKHLASVCTASGSAFMDINMLQYSDFMLKLCDVSQSQLPEIADYETTCPLTENASALLGVKSGIPVTLAFADGGLNQLASCGNLKGRMTMSVGTSGALRMTTDEPMIPEKPGSWCYYSPVSYLVGAATSGACNCVDWAKDIFFSREISYRELEEQVVDRKNLPVFLPFLFSERSPGWNDKAKGGFYELTPHHRPIDMFHATMEGVLFNLRQCYDIVTSVAKEPEAILISGGIINSPFWLQMASDIMQKELLIDPIKQASVMGGVHVAQMISGIKPTYPDVYKSVTPSTDSYEDNYNRYLEAYNKM